MLKINFKLLYLIVGFSRLIFISLENFMVCEFNNRGRLIVKILIMINDVSFWMHFEYKGNKGSSAVGEEKRNL